MDFATLLRYVTLSVMFIILLNLLQDVLVDTLYDLLLQRAGEPSLLEPTEDEIIDAATMICRFKTSHLTSDVSPLNL